MTEKELKKLNRYQLLELLILQTERADKLQEKLQEAEQALQDRALELSRLGSIAEASLQLGGVFRAAQEAADIYLDAVRKQAEQIEEAAHKKAAEILLQAQRHLTKNEG